MNSMLVMCLLIRAYINEKMIHQFIVTVNIAGKVTMTLVSKFIQKSPNSP